ncbi:hypothetical protein Ate01nite_27570 [Actinoplanes teichomyceticus]|nr:hypothetical protein Ate01nite_27570 [Actinoplanes teichomyceticus]
MFPGTRSGMVTFDARGRPAWTVACALAYRGSLRLGNHLRDERSDRLRGPVHR